MTEEETRDEIIDIINNEEPVKDSPKDTAGFKLPPSSLAICSIIPRLAAG